MNTDVLISTLSADLRPVRRGQGRAWLRTGAVAGGLCSLAVFAMFFGVRPDIGAAIRGFSFWMKAAYTVSLAMVAWHGLALVGMPGAERPRWAMLVGAPPLALATLAGGELIVLPPRAMASFWMGSSWSVCPLCVVLLASPLFAGIVWALGRLAPTRAPEAGAAAGMAAGACASVLYAFHCGETSPGFVLVWYTLGVLMTAALGTWAGPRLLRW